LNWLAPRLLASHHTIDAVIATGLLRYQRQTELLAHHASKEAADRVLLPAGCSLCRRSPLLSARIRVEN
jgi:hypothetical protein